MLGRNAGDDQRRDARQPCGRPIVIASEAKQSAFSAEAWIASLSLAMTKRSYYAACKVQ